MTSCSNAAQKSDAVVVGAKQNMSQRNELYGIITDVFEKTKDIRQNILLMKYTGLDLGWKA